MIKGKIDILVLLSKVEKTNMVNKVEISIVIKGKIDILVLLSKVEKTNMVNKVEISIILCLEDKALREVVNKIINMWMNLKLLYITKSLAHRIFFKQQ